MGFRAAVAAWLAAALAVGVARGADAPATATGAVLDDNGVFARLSVDLSRAVEATARPIGDPDRILIDIPEVNFQIDPASGKIDAPRPGAIVKAYRFGRLAPGKSRVAIELARPACIVKLELKSLASGGARLSVVLTPCEAKKFAELMKSAPDVAMPDAPPPVEAPAPAAAPPIIVLDPGHGGSDGGAHGLHGAVEKTIVFDFATELKRRLEATHKFKVVMTRADDEYVSLEDRVRIARGANAALMISIHADTLPGVSAATAADVAGTTVYTCSERASDREAARIAASENAADRVGEAGSQADAAGVADILFDLKRRETRAYAHLFSRGLVTELSGVGRLNHNPERSAGFVVLKAPDFPSVLVELGYLSNPQDVANMISAEWRTKSATAMVTAVERFFAPAPPKGAADAKPDDTIAASGRPPGAPRANEGVPQGP